MESVVNSHEETTNAINAEVGEKVEGVVGTTAIRSYGFKIVTFALCCSIFLMFCYEIHTSKVGGPIPYLLSSSSITYRYVKLVPRPYVITLGIFL